MYNATEEVQYIKVQLHQSKICHIWHYDIYNVPQVTLHQTKALRLKGHQAQRCVHLLHEALRFP